jgi:DNA-binding PadR family transcriptional regulator
MSSTLDPKHAEVLRWLIEGEPDRYAVASQLPDQEGLYHYSTLKAMERRGLVTLRGMSNHMIGTPRGTRQVATITEKGRAVAAKEGSGDDASPVKASEPPAPVVTNAKKQARKAEKYPRVVCPLCGNDRLLRHDGTFPNHLRVRTEPGTCKGTGKTPAEALEMREMSSSELDSNRPPLTGFAPEITWTRGNHGSLRGSVNRILLFTIGWGITRDEDGPYSLTTTLPGFKPPVWRCASEGTARDKADQLLRGFIDRLTSKEA